jgi:hypothetical protein
MIRMTRTVFIPVALAVLNSCGEPSCDVTMMMYRINEQIISDKRSPDEYEIAELKRKDSTVYIGMSLKMSPPYRRHYYLDVKSCKIINLVIDQ